MTGEKNAKGETTWGGLAKEVRYWGEWVLREVKKEIGDLYPPIPDPQFKEKRPEIEFDPKTGEWREKTSQRIKQMEGKGLIADDGNPGLPEGYLTPVAYLWTRTVKCKNHSCGATVPLVRQTWLCKKKDRFIAMRMNPDRKTMRARFEVVHEASETKLGFDPGAFSNRGNTACPFCGTVADSSYVKSEGQAKRMGEQMMVIVCTKPGTRGKTYLSADDYPHYLPNNTAINERLDRLCRATGLTVPDEQLVEKLTDQLPNYGVSTFKDIFTARQMLCLMTLTAKAREASKQVGNAAEDERLKAVVTLICFAIDKVLTRGGKHSQWDTSREQAVMMFGRQALPMVWDFGESFPLGKGFGSFEVAISDVVANVEELSYISFEGHLHRGSATELPYEELCFDAIITDPPYYDNIQYAPLSDFFYVWMKRTIGDLYPDHLSGAMTPKKKEAVASPWRHKNSNSATLFYEQMMGEAFKQSNRVLKSEGITTVVYAHKTTLGWSTLVDSLRSAGSIVSEAWPFDTEYSGHLKSDISSLASSIFLVARKRPTEATSQYESDVRPELERIVRERVGTLWEMGIGGADLVIACVGAGLRAFTRFAKVEYANGEPVPAERFLAEVETVVLDHILGRLSKEVGGNGGRQSLAGVDPMTRFYILWRYTYKTAELDAGEAIIFANGTGVELDGLGSLTYGTRALAEKKKAKYKLRDFSERGDDDRLGMPDGRTMEPAPLIDALHRVLWLLRNRATEMAKFLTESGVNREQLRLVAQALAGPALKGGELPDISPASELSALAELTSNWKSVIEGAVLTPKEREAEEKGIGSFKFEGGNQ